VSLVDVLHIPVFTDVEMFISSYLLPII